MYAKTGLSPTAAFAGLALPVIPSGSLVATTTCAAVRVTGFWTFVLPICLLVIEGIIPDASGEARMQQPWHRIEFQNGRGDGTLFELARRTVERRP
jgi:hypothetical protein